MDQIWTPFYEALRTDNIDAALLILKEYRRHTSLSSKFPHVNNERTVEAAFQGYRRKKNIQIINFLYCYFYPVPFNEIANYCINHYLIHVLIANVATYQMSILPEDKSFVDNIIGLLFNILKPDYAKLTAVFEKIRKNLLLIKTVSLMRKQNSPLKYILLQTVNNDFSPKEMTVVLTHKSFKELVKGLYKIDYKNYI